MESRDARARAAQELFFRSPTARMSSALRSPIQPLLQRRASLRRAAAALLLASRTRFQPGRMTPSARTCDAQRRSPQPKVFRRPFDLAVEVETQNSKLKTTVWLRPPFPPASAGATPTPKSWPVVLSRPETDSAIPIAVAATRVCPGRPLQRPAQVGLLNFRTFRWRAIAYRPHRRLSIPAGKFDRSSSNRSGPSPA